MKIDQELNWSVHVPFSFAFVVDKMQFLTRMLYCTFKTFLTFNKMPCFQIDFRDRIKVQTRK